MMTNLTQSLTVTAVPAGEWSACLDHFTLASEMKGMPRH